MTSVRVRRRREIAAVVVTLLIAGCGGDVARPTPASVVADPPIGELLVASCYPCHASGSAPPWYARIAPSSWPSSARSVLDLADWPAWDPTQRAAARSAIAAAIEAGNMPPADYTFFDHAARLTADDRHRLAQWATSGTAAPPAP